jgi:hypothetical protein
MSSNSLKIRVLAALDGRGWLNAPMISALAEFRPVRAVYVYMKRLQRWGLVRRRTPLGSLILWEITNRGRERLRWLNRATI